MDIMSSMKYALQAGTPKASTQASKKVSRWPAEFRRPVDVALHLGTPKPSLGPIKEPVSVGARTWKIFD